MDRPDDARFVAALVDEATKRSAVAWLRRLPPTGDRPHPVWLAWHEGAAYVLHGGAEQAAPALDEAAAPGGAGGPAEVAVSVPSKDRGGHLVTWVARAERLAPGSADWEAAALLLRGKRLNLPDTDASPRRWADESTITRLVPTGRVTDAPAAGR